MTIFQETLALQLTQKSLPKEWIEAAAFNKDKDIRVLTCNFLYYWQLKNNFNINLFVIKPASDNNHEWFKLLTDIILVAKNINLKDLFDNKINDLKGR